MLPALAVFKAADLEFASISVSFQTWAEPRGLVCDLHVECGPVGGACPFRPAFWLDEPRLDGLESIEAGGGQRFALSPRQFTVYTFEPGETHAVTLTLRRAAAGSVMLDLEGEVSLGVLGRRYLSVPFTATIPAPSAPTLAPRLGARDPRRSAHRELQANASHFKANRCALVNFLRGHLKTAHPERVAGLDDDRITQVIHSVLEVEQLLGARTEPVQLLGAVVLSPLWPRAPDGSAP